MIDKISVFYYKSEELLNNLIASQDLDLSTGEITNSSKLNDVPMSKGYYNHPEGLYTIDTKKSKRNGAAGTFYTIITFNPSKICNKEYWDNPLEKHEFEHALNAVQKGLEDIGFTSDIRELPLSRLHLQKTILFDEPTDKYFKFLSLIADALLPYGDSTLVFGSYKTKSAVMYDKQLEYLQSQRKDNHNFELPECAKNALRLEARLQDSKRVKQYYFNPTCEVLLDGWDKLNERYVRILNETLYSKRMNDLVETMSSSTDLSAIVKEKHPRNLFPYLMTYLSAEYVLSKFDNDFDKIRNFFKTIMSESSASRSVSELREISLITKASNICNQSDIKIGELYNHIKELFIGISDQVDE